MAEHHRIIDTLRLSKSDLEEILAELDRDLGQGTASSRRKCRRWPLRMQKIVVTLMDEMGGKRHLLCAPRNLSSTGLAFLCGGFVHHNSRCVITIRDRNQHAHNLRARVVRCSHVRGSLHDVGVEFEDTIVPSEYVLAGNAEYHFNSENVTLSELRGKVLIVDHFPPEQRLIAHHFRGSNIELMFANDGQSALEYLHEDPDLIFLECELPDVNGLDVVRQARRLGCLAPIVLITLDKAAYVRKDAIEAGANEILYKPFAPELLHRAAAEYLLLTHRPREDERPHGLPAMPRAPIAKDLAEQFVEDLQRAATELEALIAQEDRESIERMIPHLISSATGYGFETIARNAQEALDTLQATKDLEHSVLALRRLMRTCQRAIVPGAGEADAEGAAGPGGDAD